MSVRRANQTNPLEAKCCERPDQLKVTRNCDHHVLEKIQTLTALNTRRKTHTGERKLTNKFTINEKWLALQGKKPRCFLKSV